MDGLREAELSTSAVVVVVGDVVPSESRSSSPHGYDQSPSDDNLYHHSAASSAAGSPSTPASAAKISTARALVLKGIKESELHSLMLQKLQRSEQGYQREATKEKRRVRRLSKEMYQVVSIYALLQGALFAAVAQTTIFTCVDWWGPVFIAGAVMVGTVLGVLDTICRIGQSKKKAEAFQRRQNLVNDQIQRLIFFGSACSMDSLQPGFEALSGLSPSPHCVFSLHGALVLLFLVGFSCLIITCCMYMLCHSCTCPR